MSAGDSNRFLEHQWNTASTDCSHLTMSAPTLGGEGQESLLTLILVKSNQRLISLDTTENTDAHQGTFTYTNQPTYSVGYVALGEPVKMNRVSLRTVIHT